MAAPYKGIAKELQTHWWLGELLVIYILLDCVAASAITAYDLQHSFKNYNVLQEKAWKISTYIFQFLNEKRVSTVPVYVDIIYIKRITKWYAKFGEYNLL